MEEKLVLDVRKKNKRKKIRSVFQLVFLLVVFLLCFRVVFYQREYIPAVVNERNQQGFIAVSYFGVSRSGSDTLIAKNQLEKHLETLEQQGYQTISQQDIINYYTKNQPLPDKALFLAFEDGRNDSSIFAQPLLERLNFKATILTYADKFGEKDFKFLQPKELKKMEKSGFWELGSNGYRLSYINIDKKDGTYVEEEGEEEFNLKNTKNYNHYLMDFLRDKDGIPIEERTGMDTRISKDYQLLYGSYKRNFGEVPKLYAIMHANTMYNGMNTLVEDVNRKNIKDTFQIHFNREGNSFNNKEDDIFNLTRVQPAPYWSVNHLLMRMKSDSGESVQFIKGNTDQAAEWKTSNSVAEFHENQIILTTLPNKIGKLTLKETVESGEDYGVNVEMDAIPDSRSSIYVKFNKSLGTYMRVILKEDGTVSIVQNMGEKEELIKTTSKKGKDIRLEIKNDQLSVWLDKERLLSNYKVDSQLTGKEVALAVEPIIKKNELVEGNMFTNSSIADGYFTNVEIYSLEDKSTKKKMIFSNSPSGFQKVKGIILEKYQIVINWAIDTF